MTIFRYLSKEVFNTLMAITAILLLVFLSNLFVRYLGYAASGDFSVSLVFKFVAIQIPYLLGLLLPLGFFIALLLAYGRLYADSEMTVLFACGMSKARLVKMTVAMAVLLAIFVGAMMFWMIPRLLAYRNNLMAQAREDVGTQVLFPGSFQQLNNGAQVIYVESLGSNHEHARNIFLGMRSKDSQTTTDALGMKQSQWTVVSAKQGYRDTDPITQDQFAVAVNGYRYVGKPGDQDYSIAKFAKFGLRINQKVAAPSNREENLNTTKLWAGYATNQRYAAELQWRIAMPMATLVLAFLGVALSRIDPRKGKYAQLLPATAVAIVYANLLFVARNWIRSGDVSPMWGIWWVHGVFFALALLLLLNRDYVRFYLNALWQWWQRRYLSGEK